MINISSFPVWIKGKLENKCTLATAGPCTLKKSCDKNILTQVISITDIRLAW